MGALFEGGVAVEPVAEVVVLPGRAGVGAPLVTATRTSILRTLRAKYPASFRPGDEWAESRATLA